MGRPKTGEGTKLRSVRFPLDLYQAIGESASKNERSFSREMIFRLRKQIKASGAKVKRA